MTHGTISVLFVDDENTFADAMRFAIDREPMLRCVGTAHDVAEAVAIIERDEPDCCLLNLDLRSTPGIEALDAIRRAAPRMPITVLTSRTEVEVLRAAEAAGADHLVPSVCSMNDVLKAIRSPSTGSMTLPGMILFDVMWRHDHPVRFSGADGLTARELDVLREMAAGDPPKTIATAMGISIHTVRGHVKNIYWKLDAHSQLEAVAIARRRGLLSDVA
jgi:DNA-binding NarL/FixJ family response regulator